MKRLIPLAFLAFLVVPWLLGSFDIKVLQWWASAWTLLAIVAFGLGFYFGRKERGR